MAHPEKFWLVWCPTGLRPPSHRHDTEESAEREARRLAELNPGRQFFVLAALKVAEVRGLTITTLNSPASVQGATPSYDDGMPF